MDWELLLSDDTIHRTDHFLLAEYVTNIGVIETWRDARVIDLTLSQLRRDFEELKADYQVKTASLNPGGDLAVNSVGNAQMKDNAVGTAEIQDLAVTTQKLAAGSVINAKLADNSVGSNKIIDGSVGQAELADSAVVQAKIANAAVTADKLAANSVDGAKLAAGSVTSAKIAASSVAVSHFKFLTTLNTSFTMNAGAVTNVTLLHKVFVGPENFLVYTVWSDEDLSWSEFMVNGSRMLKITNNTAVTVTVNVVARLIQVN